MGEWRTRSEDTQNVEKKKSTLDKHRQGKGKTIQHKPKPKPEPNLGGINADWTLNIHHHSRLAWDCLCSEFD
jgi:hypothetical protein